MKTTTVLAVLLLAASPALAQSVGEKSGVNSVLGVTPSTEDFVLQAAQSDMFEIQSSKLASTQSDKVKDFAQQMVEAHSKTTSELKSAVGSKMTLPTDVSSSQKSMLDDLKTRKGDDLADQYIDDQVSAHKDAVSLFQRYADGGDSPELKAWAAKTLPDLQHHLEMAQALDK
ncbi:DUF4142 domain-containing protein [Hansschlegelia quercus]|uniref:DUF4142 domain-containing protein n=1 Tax=Hansschlegelia quercus TaxID=2528245 RepID=A0A4Q9GG80_9HYPH|nr:DUF4142 domain-containing protein [Hansschlegelia quercus]TBN52476.1 DUF4142 domain-containing protein [Hansschlegelia quercus]